MRVLQPEGWSRPKGYANGIEATGRTVFVAGQVGWDKDQRFTAKDFAGQFEQALGNILAVLKEAGARPEHIVRLTWFVTDKRAYLAQAAEVGAAYRRLMGRHYPAMSVVQVSALMEDEALVEIEATAVVGE
ncbi:MAG: RidA family protein [Alphaproteobacteria bacterium]|nr:RidA family protein [Alphaproteobacteria bacterium]MBV9695167.1 RidA family protein [Alphaproteobacteria bacterium]